jgi:aubergine-like protein
LLGLSSEAEKTLKGQQKSLGKLGRDQLATFKSFASAGESAVSRYIRTGCDVLGPRGDAKNGCRDAWEAFCGMKEFESVIGSYRSNRFNNFFECASALHHHRQSIEDFFSNYRQNPNLKLRSVLADCQCDKIDALLTAVGILHYAVTGPYWKLITSQVEYLDLHQYFVPMREKFLEFSKDASSLVGVVPQSVIPGFSMNVCNQVRSLQNVKDKQLVKETLEKLVHHDVQDEELRRKMKHCQLTNLTGEANLADLDFTMFTRRNATLHHRSLST